jgi:hypothetical protein
MAGRRYLAARALELIELFEEATGDASAGARLTHEEMVDS